jgi:hypothetical protein
VGNGMAHHVVFHFVGLKERPLERHDSFATSASEVATRVRAVAQALCALGQQVSFVEDVTNAGASGRESTCDALKRRLPAFSQFVHPSVVMRREAVERVGGYRRHEAEDDDLFLRISERFDVVNLDRPLHRLRRTGTTRVARFEREIVESVRQCAQLARQRCIEGLDHAADPARRRRPILGLPLADLQWLERRPYARTLHALGEALADTDRRTAQRLFARAAVLAPEIREHWRSWFRAALARLVKS